MSEIRVSNQSELIQALEAAQGGETIVLAGGEYGTLALVSFLNENIDFSKGLTFVGEDPEDPPIFSGLALFEADNVTLDGITFQYTHTDGASLSDTDFKATNSNNVTITNSTFLGDDIEKYGVSDYAVGTGFKAYNTDGLTFTNNELDGLFRGAFFDGGTDMDITHNDVHSMSGDGFAFTAISDTSISENHFHDFDIPEDNTGHLDMIQFWVQREGAQSENVLISKNVLDSGTGHYTQGIFIGNELVAGGASEENYHQNITISDNVIYNGHQHGITVASADNLNITNNTLLHNDNDVTSYEAAPRINVDSGSKSVLIENNIAAGPYPEAEQGWTVSNNLEVQRTDPTGENYYGDLFVNALSDEGASLDDLRALPDSIITDAGLGSTYTQGDGAGYTFITAEAGEGLERMSINFDLSHAVEAQSNTLPEITKVSWILSDGTTAEGMNLKHSFDWAGEYVVEATAEYSDGSTERFQKTIEVLSPVLASYFQGPEVASNAAGVSARLIEAHELSVAFSLKPSEINSSTAQTILSLDKGLKVVIHEESLVFIVNTENGLNQFHIQDQSLLDNEWHDVLFTFDGEKGKVGIYLDGQLLSDETIAGGQTLQASGQFDLGATSYLDEVMVLDTVVSDTDVAALVTSVVDGWQTTSEGDQDIQPPLADDDTEDNPDNVEEPATNEDANPDADDNVDQTLQSTPLKIESPAMFVGGGIQGIRLESTPFSMRDSSLFSDLNSFTFSFDFKDSVGYSGGPERLFTFNDIGMIKSADTLTLWAKVDGEISWLTASDLDIPSQSWNNVTVSYAEETSEIKLFLNGEVVASEENFALLYSNDEADALVFSGTRQGSSFEGSVSDIFIARETLTDSEVRSLAGESFSADEFDASSDVQIVASSPQAQVDLAEQLTFEKSVLFLDQAYDSSILEGKSQAVYAESFFSNLDEFSVSFDFKNSDAYTGNAERILSIKDGITITKNGSSIAFSLTTATGTAVFNMDAPSFGDSAWHNVAMTYSAASETAIVYIDGNIAHVESNLSGGSIVGNSTLQLGADTTVGFDGVLEDAVFSQEAFSYEQVAALAERDLDREDFLFDESNVGFIDDFSLV